MAIERQSGDKAEKNPALVALGKQIRRMRESRHISQEDFAFKAGIDRSYYGSIERGQRNVAALNLMRIASALNCEVGELFPDLQAVRGLLAGSSGGTVKEASKTSSN